MSRALVTRLRNEISGGYRQFAAQHADRRVARQIHVVDAAPQLGRLADHATALATARALPLFLSFAKGQYGGVRGHENLREQCPVYQAVVPTECGTSALHREGCAASLRRVHCRRGKEQRTDHQTRVSRFGGGRHHADPVRLRFSR